MTALHFILFRIALGAYTAFFFFSLAPYGHEFAAPACGAFLAGVKCEYAAAARWACYAAGVAGILFACGWQRRIMAVLLWAGWACATTRIPWLQIPSDGYIGWLLLACIFIPGGENWKSGQSWQIPRRIVLAAWLLIGVSYTFSGLTKLESPLWQNGEALGIVFASPIARDSGSLLLGLGPEFLHVLSYASLAVELCAGPLVLFRAGRKLVWVALTLFHIVILATLNVGSVSCAMLVVQLFLFDTDWLRDPRSMSEAEVAQ